MVRSGCVDLMMYLRLFRLLGDILLVWTVSLYSVLMLKLMVFIFAGVGGHISPWVLKKEVMQQ